jgi:ferredoxin
MTEIRIKINCNGEWCGKCALKVIDRYDYRECVVFKETVGAWGPQNRPRRCLQCLAAEVKG